MIFHCAGKKPKQTPHCWFASCQAASNPPVASLSHMTPAESLLPQECTDASAVTPAAGDACS
jgi:hypothetical protein